MFLHFSSPAVSAITGPGVCIQIAQLVDPSVDQQVVEGMEDWVLVYFNGNSLSGTVSDRFTLSGLASLLFPSGQPSSPASFGYFGDPFPEQLLMRLPELLLGRPGGLDI